MKALVKSRAERGLWLEDVPEPAMGINDVKIRVLKTGICGTDLHIYEWDAWASAHVPVGLTIGHEFVGEIVDVGANVSRLCPRRRSSAAKVTWCADAAATAWPGVAISALTPKAWA